DELQKTQGARTPEDLRRSPSHCSGMKPAASGSGQRISRVVTFPQCGAFISLTTYDVGATAITIATCPYTLYVPPGRYTAIAPTARTTTLTPRPRALR